MKKILLIICVILVSISFGQYTSGTVTAGPLTLKIDTDPTTVTLTATAPSTSWFGFGFGGNTMSTVSDMFIWNSTTSRDYTPSGANTAPSPDASQSWTMVSDNVVSGTRTIVYTRPLTAAGDYTFQNNTTSIPIIYAAGSSITLAYHGNTRSATTLTRTLSVEEMENKEIQIKIYPNPTSEVFQLDNNNRVKSITLYDLAGKNVATFQNQEEYNIQSLISGTYFAEIILDNHETKYEKVIKK